MRSVDINGEVIAGTRSPSGGLSIIDASGTQDPQKLADELRRLSNRLSELEGKKPHDAVEFELACGASGTVKLSHGFNSPVRWWVTSWKRSAAVAPILTESATSTPTVLILNSAVDGQAVVRVESVQAPTKAL